MQQSKHDQVTANMPAEESWPDDSSTTTSSTCSQELRRKPVFGISQFQDRKFLIENKPWIEDIEEVMVMDNEWNCFIIFLIETDPLFYGVVNILTRSMASGKRKVVRVISEETVKTMAMDHCFKTVEDTPFSALCEAVRIAGGHKFRESIPADLLAYMIKYIIMLERDFNIKARTKELKLKHRANTRYVTMALLRDIDFEGNEDELEKDEEVDSSVKQKNKSDKSIKSRKSRSKSTLKNEKRKSSRKNSLGINSKKVNAGVKGTKGKIIAKNENLELLQSGDVVRADKEVSTRKQDEESEESDLFDSYSESGKSNETEVDEDETDVDDLCSEEIRLRKELESKIYKNFSKYKRCLWKEKEKEVIKIPWKKMKTVLKECKKKIDRKQLLEWRKEVQEKVRLRKLKYEEKEERMLAEARRRRYSNRNEEDVGDQNVKKKELTKKKKKKKLLNNKQPKNNNQHLIKDEEMVEDEDLMQFPEEKIDTLLHKRGKPIQDVHTVDDSPLDCPNLFIFLSSFKENELPKILDQLHVPISAYLFVGQNESEELDPIKLTENKNDEYMNNYGDYFSLLSASFIETYANWQQLEPDVAYNVLKKSIKQFNREFFKLKENKESENVDNVIYCHYLPNMEGIDLNTPEWIKTLSTRLYDDVSKIGYHLYKITQLYDRYLQHTPLKDVYDFAPGSIEKKRKMKFYNKLLDKIPNELVNVPLILDTIIAQVCVNDASHIGYTLSDYITGKEEISHVIKNFITGVEELEEKYFSKDSSDKIPHSIWFGDELALYTYQYGQLGRLIRDRNEHILNLFFNKVWMYIEPNNEQTLQNNIYHYRLLQKACQDANIKDGQPVIDILLSLMALDRNRIKTNEPSSTIDYPSSRVIGTTKRGQINTISTLTATNMLSSPSYSTVQSNYTEIMYALRQLEQKTVAVTPETMTTENISFAGSSEECLQYHQFIKEIATKLKHISEDKGLTLLLKNVTHFETMPKPVFLQTLWQVVQEYNTVEIQYVPIIDKLIFTCYDQHLTINEQGRLPTYMSLRDFFNFGLNELEEWCTKQNKKIIEKQIEDAHLPNLDKLKDNIVDPIEPVVIAPNKFILPSSFDIADDFTNDLKDEVEDDESITQDHAKALFQFLDSIPSDILNDAKLDGQVKNEYADRNLYSLDGYKTQTNLYTNIRHFVFMDGTVVTIKVFSEIYKPNKYTISIKQNFCHLNYHTMLNRDFDEDMLIFSHPTGIQVSFSQPINKLPLITEEVNVVEDSVEKNPFDEHVQLDENKGNVESENEYEFNDSYLLTDENEEIEEVDVGEDDNKLTSDSVVKFIYRDGFPELLAKALGHSPSFLYNVPNDELVPEFQFKCSLPTGLLIEKFCIENLCSYIKQRYLIKGIHQKAIKNEVFRLVLNNSMVVKLMENGSLEIFYPCGRWLKFINSKLLNATLLKHRGRLEPKLCQNLLNKNKDKDEFYIMEPDGSCYSVINGYKKLINKLQFEEYNDIFKNSRKVVFHGGSEFVYNQSNIQWVTFLDGTRISSELREEDEEVFCEWEKNEMKLWFEYEWSEEDEDGEEEKSDDITTRTSTLTRQYSGYKTRRPSLLKNSRRFSKKQLHTNGSVIKSKTGLKNKNGSLKQVFSMISRMSRASKAPKRSKHMRKKRFLFGVSQMSFLDEPIIEYEKIDLKKDGFVCLTLSYFVEHPMYVQTLINPNKIEKIIMLLPQKINIINYQNGWYDLQSSNDTRLLIRENEIDYQNFRDNILIQNSTFYYRAFEEHINTNKEECKMSQPLVFTTVDKLGNWLSADILGTVLYKVCTNLNSSWCCDAKDDPKLFTDEFRLEKHEKKYLKKNTRRLVLNRDCSGMELLLEENINSFEKLLGKEIMERKEKFKENPFIGHFYRLPIAVENDKWYMDYLDIGNKMLYYLPSTYGHSVLHPFTPKNLSQCVSESGVKAPEETIPDVILMRFTNEFINKNLEDMYKIIITEYQHNLLETHDIIRKSFLEEPSLIIQNPRELPLNEIGVQAIIIRKLLYKNTLQQTSKFCYDEIGKFKELSNLEKKCEFTYKKLYCRNYFRKKAHDIYFKHYCPYFSTPEGVAFMILDSVLTETMRTVAAIYLKKNIDIILDKPMELLNEDELLDLEIFLTMYHDQFWGKDKKIDVKKLIKSVLELNDYFPNMRNALEINVKYQGKYTIIDSCCKKLMNE